MSVMTPEQRVAELEAVMARVRALIPERPIPLYDAKGDFEGFQGGPEHRTVGDYRAWSYDYSEWCYPDEPCRGCEQTVDMDELRAAVGQAVSWDQR